MWGFGKSEPYTSTTASFFFFSEFSDSFQKLDLFTIALHLCRHPMTERKCQLTVQCVLVPVCVHAAVLIWGNGVLLLTVLLCTRVGIS
jgi:hypothetical protein